MYPPATSRTGSLHRTAHSNSPQEWKDNYYNEWTNIMTTLRGFQCIVCWVPFNEDWGQFDTPQVVKYTKEFDPTRLVNEAMSK